MPIQKNGDCGTGEHNTGPPPLTALNQSTISRILIARARAVQRAWHRQSEDVSWPRQRSRQRRTAFLAHTTALLGSTSCLEGGGICNAVFITVTNPDRTQGYSPAPVKYYTQESTKILLIILHRGCHMSVAVYIILQAPVNNVLSNPNPEPITPKDPSDVHQYRDHWGICIEQLTTKRKKLWYHIDIILVFWSGFVLISCAASDARHAGRQSHQSSRLPRSQIKRCQAIHPLETAQNTPLLSAYDTSDGAWARTATPPKREVPQPFKHNYPLTFPVLGGGHTWSQFRHT